MDHQGYLVPLPELSAGDTNDGDGSGGDSVVRKGAGAKIGWAECPAPATITQRAASSEVVYELPTGTPGGGAPVSGQTSTLYERPSAGQQPMYEALENGGASAGTGPGPVVYVQPGSPQQQQQQATYELRTSEQQQPQVTYEVPEQAGAGSSAVVYEPPSRDAGSRQQQPTYEVTSVTSGPPPQGVTYVLVTTSLLCN